MIEGAKLLRWDNQIGQLKPGYFADIIAVPGNPLDDITAVRTSELSLWKGGAVVRPVALIATDGVRSLERARLQ